MHDTQSGINPFGLELILFDFGGVLAEEGFGEGLQYIAQHNTLDPAQFLKTAFEITFESGYVIGNIDERAFWKSIKEHTGVKGSDNALRNEILSRFKLRAWMRGAHHTNLKSIPFGLPCSAIRLTGLMN